MSKNERLGLACTLSAALLSACAAPNGSGEPANESARGPDMYHAFPFVDFVNETGFRPAELAPCGPAISVGDVMVLDVEASGDTADQVASMAGREARITSDWVGYRVETSPDRARRDLARLLAEKGCDLLVLNGMQTAVGGEGVLSPRTERRYLMAAWGVTRGR